MRTLIFVLCTLFSAPTNADNAVAFTYNLLWSKKPTHELLSSWGTPADTRVSGTLVHYRYEDNGCDILVNTGGGYIGSIIFRGDCTKIKYPFPPEN